MIVIEGAFIASVVNARQVAREMKRCKRVVIEHFDINLLKEYFRMGVIVRNKRAMRLDVTKTSISASFKDYGDRLLPKIRDDRKLERPLPDFKTP